MREIIFLVEESEDGGYTAKALGESIFTQGDSLEELRSMAKDAVKCHFNDDLQRIVRLRFVKEEIFAA
ncbi:2-oxoisovalerate dehydrogenase E1 subunit beta [soil metagenome]